MLWGCGECQFCETTVGSHRVARLPTPLLGHLPELGESMDLRPPRLAETHLCFSWHPSSGTTSPPLPIHPACSPPHPQFQNSLFADIYSALPQPGSLPRPGQCSGKGGSFPTKGWGFSPHSPLLGPHWQPQSGPRTRPAPRLRLGLHGCRSPGSGEGGKAGAEASHLPPRAALEVCGGRSAQSTARAPVLGDAPCPRRERGVGGMRLCPPVPGKARMRSRLGEGAP